MALLVEPILKEFRDEMPATRRLLERVPQDKLAWKPHPKSRSLGELALHIANLPGMAEKIATAEEFAAGAGTPSPATDIEAIRAAFEKNSRSGEEALTGLSDEAAQKDWRLIFRGKELLRRPRLAPLRDNMLNHLYHHRGQISVYLRLLDVPVPVVYGPTADENPFA